MIRTRLTYHAPLTTEQACSLLVERGEGAAVLGGGTWLVPQMTRGERTVTDVVDLRRLGLVGVVERDGEVEVGAMTTYADLLASPVLRGRAPLLQTVAAGVTGGRQIHNLGTIGGSACFASPSSDMPACLVALDARMSIRGPSGAREVAARDFFLDAFRSAPEPGEILTAIVIPEAHGAVGYDKLKLCESSWPIATAAAVLADGAPGAGAGAGAGGNVTLGGVARTPLRIDLADVQDTEGAGGISVERIDAVVAERLDDPWDDELAPGSYRRAVAAVIARRAIERATRGNAR
jgi:carbon-monoxide dehydrogenase medium subunit